MIEMTLELAQRAAQAALDRAKEIGARMSVAVVDESGRTVLMLRGDGASFLGLESSRAKAVTATNFRRSTKELCETAPNNTLFWQAAPIVTKGDLMASLGGVPIKKGDRVIGGIGCGGGQGVQDHDCAEHGAQAAFEAG
jgi:glc operon protein GlcG